MVCGDLVSRFRNIVGKSNFSDQFRKLINRYKRIGYSLDIMRQTACLVNNPIIVGGYASLFNCTTAVRDSASMTTLLKTLTSLLGLDGMFFGLTRRGSTIGFHLLLHTVKLSCILFFVYHSD